MEINGEARWDKGGQGGGGAREEIKRGWRGSEAKVGHTRKGEKQRESASEEKWASPNKSGKKIYGGHLTKEADVKFDESWVKRRQEEARLQFLYFSPCLLLPLDVWQGTAHPLQLSVDVRGSLRRLNSPHSIALSYLCKRQSLFCAWIRHDRYIKHSSALGSV